MGSKKELFGQALLTKYDSGAISYKPIDPVLDIITTMVFIEDLAFWYNDIAFFESIVSEERDIKVINPCDDPQTLNCEITLYHFTKFFRMRKNDMFSVSYQITPTNLSQDDVKEILSDMAKTMHSFAIHFSSKIDPFLSMTYRASFVKFVTGIRYGLEQQKIIPRDEIGAFSSAIFREDILPIARS